MAADRKVVGSFAAQLARRKKGSPLFGLCTFGGSTIHKGLSGFEPENAEDGLALLVDQHGYFIKWRQDDLRLSRESVLSFLVLEANLLNYRFASRRVLTRVIMTDPVVLFNEFWPRLQEACVQATIGDILVSSLLLFGLYALTAGIYNLHFHRLAAFPGPFLARSSLIWRMYHSQTGRFHFAIHDQHRKHGSVVRVSPNELSFASVDSWKAIYGHRASGMPIPIKSEFYEIYGAGFESLCIGSERDPHKHGRMRKMLSAAFSTKFLLEQEDIITKVVNEFILRLGTDGSQPKGLNMTKWYEMVTFDSLGEMAFGQSFGSVNAGKPHSWSEIIVNHLYFITLADNLSRLPFVATLARLLFPSTQAIKNQNSQYSRRKVEERLTKKNDRNDFLSTVVKSYEEKMINKEEVAAHVSTLTIAGAETTATFLAAATYYLLRNPTCLAKLQNEITSKFSSYEDINATAARQLPYLQAVISEGLRIYSPGSQGFPRLSPGMKVGEVYVPAGAEVFTHLWTMTHSEEFFSDPTSFKPERWLDPNSTDIREASQPFSMGPRGCLGQNFAYMEINLILAKMLWKYHLELINKELDWLKESQLHVMWWKPALMVNFEERQRH